jgi:uncharacterized protein YjiS (DUF1127 family)
MVGENVDLQVMSSTAGPNCVPPSRSARWPAFAVLFSAIEEGLVSAARYETLARKTNRELADLGVDRKDLPRFVMFGDA